MNKKIIEARTISAFAEVYVNTNTSALSIPNGSGYTKLSIANSAIGNIKNCTVSLANGTITVNKPGKYFINCAFSSKLGTTDVVWDTAVFVNDEEATNLHMRRKFSTTGYTFNVAISGIADLEAGDVLDIRSKHDKASAVAITTEYANISLCRISL